MPEFSYTTSFNCELIIEYSIQSAEPDVGIMSAFADEWLIVAVGNALIPSNHRNRLDKLYNKLKRIKHKRFFSNNEVSEYELIEEKANEEAASYSPWDDFDG